MAKVYTPVTKIVYIARITRNGQLFRPADVMYFEVTGVDEYQCKSEALDLACPYFGGCCTVISVTDKPTEQEETDHDNYTENDNLQFATDYYDEQYS